MDAGHGPQRGTADAAQHARRPSTEAAAACRALLRSIEPDAITESHTVARTRAAAADPGP